MFWKISRGFIGRCVWRYQVWCMCLCPIVSDINYVIYRVLVDIYVNIHYYIVNVMEKYFETFQLSTAYIVAFLQWRLGRLHGCP